MLTVMNSCPQAASSVDGRHEVCTVTDIKVAHRRPAKTHSVRVGNPEITRRRHHRLPTSSEYSRWGEREGVGRASQLSCWIAPMERDMSDIDGEMLPG